MNCEFMIASTPLPPCMPLPKAMLRLPVSNTAKVMYARLLDEILTRGTEDSNGILFIRFPVMEIAAALSRSPQTCKRCGHERNRADDKGLTDKGNRGERHPKTGKDTGAGVQPVCRRHKSPVPCGA